MNWTSKLHPSDVGRQRLGDEAATKRASEESIVRNTRMGVVKLLASYKEEQLSKLLKQRYGRNFRTENDIPAYIRREDAGALNRIRLEVDRRAAAIIKTEGKIANYLDFNVYEIGQLAIRLAEQEYCDPADKIKFAEKLLGTPVPGSSQKSQYERTCTAVFWRRALTMRVSRAREHFFLRLGLIGKEKEKYSSSFSVDAREQQLHAQEKWMRETVLAREKNDNESDDVACVRPEISLSAVVKRPEHKFAKLYAFVKGMESLGEKQNLASAMVTITLDPRWHPNPLQGKNKWNGKSPREAHKSFCKGWQAIMRDLEREGIKLSGLRVVEPHRDACPHYHIWLLYRTEHEKKILLAIMRYFPLGLKVRTPGAGELSDKDEIYENRSDVAGGASRLWRGTKDKFQVEFSRIVRKLDANGERRPCSSASYVMKYLMKTLPANVSKTPTRSKDGANDGKSSDGVDISRVDAFRSVWGINQGQLFGVAKCLTIWDELRRIQHPPEHPRMKDLWKKARGGDAIGRIEKCSEQKGDAHAFLAALGGLDAARNGKQNSKRLVVGRLVEEALNRYGDVIKRTTGIRLLEKERKKVKEVDSIGRSTRYRWKILTEVVVSITTKIEKWKFVKIRADLFNLNKKSTATRSSTA